MKGSNDGRVDVALLLECVEKLRQGESVDAEAILRRCPGSKRDRLQLAIEAAALFETAAREARPFMGQLAQERAWNKLRARLGI